MRLPERLSYSSFSLFERDKEDFYLQHMADVRAPRQQQERPASVGSAFDAYTKSALHESLFGKSNPDYDFEALFEKQVEPHNRDWAREEGKYIFECYVLSGAYECLLGLLSESQTPPRFEWTVNAVVNGVPFTGKPDCQFVTKEGVHVVHDWKVNGYCSKSGVSPGKGYMVCRDGYVDPKQSRSNGKAHKLFEASELKGLLINKFYLEHCCPEWADQLSLYSWSLGEEIGDETVVLSVDQIVGRPRPDTKPLLRVATFRARVSEQYQRSLAGRFRDAWDAINGSLFNEETAEHLEEKALRLKIEDPYFNRISRPAFWS